MTALRLANFTDRAQVMCQFNKTHKDVFQKIKSDIKQQFPHLVKKSLKAYKDFLNNTIESSSDKAGNSSIDSV